MRTGQKKTKKQKLQKNFDKELGDTSRTALKGFRYEATHHEKNGKYEKDEIEE